MPSKRAKAFRWVLNVAMPTIYPSEALCRTTLVCTDQEEGLIHALRGSMRFGGTLPNAKHRLDKFHLFILPWKDKVRIETSVSLTIYNWIDGWFHKLENIYEFNHSYIKLKAFLGMFNTNLVFINS